MGCGCLIALASALSPRLALFLMLLFTDRIPEAYDDNWLFPILGFFLLPWTTLAWAVVWAPFPIDGIQGFGWVIVAFAFIVDLGTYASSDRARRERRTA